MTPTELLRTALAAQPDTAERVLFAAAAFDALTASSMVLVGGGAQVTHTGIGRLTEIDLVGVITIADEERLGEHGFAKVGRHWVYGEGGQTLAIQVPSETVLGEEAPELTDLGPVTVRVISVTDLMMDRLVQATDGTEVTWDEALALAVAAFDRVDWDSLRERAGRVVVAEPYLRELTGMLERLHVAAR